MTQKNFYRFNVANLMYTLLVIGWGAFVRATGSGAGCGDHWPLCNGEVLPKPHTLQMAIEFFHRATSGISLLLVVGAFFWSRKIAGPGSLIRKAGLISLIAILMEAALGAGLVLLKLVEFDQSVLRAVSISLHLINTVFLLSSLATLTWLSHPNQVVHEFPRQKILSRNSFFWFTLIIFLGLGVSGAITALGDTLFPSSSLAQGMAQDLHPEAHFLVKLRVIHPLMALIWVMLAFLWSRKLESTVFFKVRNYLLLGVTTQFILGMLNWMLMAPAWLQIVHLLVADLVYLAFWISGLEYEARNRTEQA